MIPAWTYCRGCFGIRWNINFTVWGAGPRIFILWMLAVTISLPWAPGVSAVSCRSRPLCPFNTISTQSTQGTQIQGLCHMHPASTWHPLHCRQCSNNTRDPRRPGVRGWGRGIQPTGLSTDPTQGRRENRCTQETLCPFSLACFPSLRQKKREHKAFNHSPKKQS